MRAQLQAIFLQRTRDDWLAYLADKNVCIGPVNTAAEVFADPQVQHRQMLLAHRTAAGEVVQRGWYCSEAERHARVCGTWAHAWVSIRTRCSLPWVIVRMTESGCAHKAPSVEPLQRGDGMGRKTAWGLDDLVPLMPQVRPVLATMQPGVVVEVQIA